MSTERHTISGGLVITKARFWDLCNVHRDRGGVEYPQKNDEAIRLIISDRQGQTSIQWLGEALSDKT
jgi:hypothetical protein